MGGEVLLTTVGVDGGPKQSFVFAETVAFTVVAIPVQTTATGLAKDLLGLEDKESGDAGSDKTVETASQSDGKGPHASGTDGNKVDENSGGSSSTMNDSSPDPRKVVAE